MFRDPLSISTRDGQVTPVAMTAPDFTRRAGVALRPSGLARYDDGILEIVGDGLRVAARDVVSIALMPALGARLQLRLSYRKGLDTIQRRYWVPVAEHDALQRLALQVRAATAAADRA